MTIYKISHLLRAWSTLYADGVIGPFQAAITYLAGIVPFRMAGADCALLGIKPSDFSFHFFVVLRFKHRQHS
jgi:hypothetical protein